MKDGKEAAYQLAFDVVVILTLLLIGIYAIFHQPQNTARIYAGTVVYEVPERHIRYIGGNLVSFDWHGEVREVRDAVVVYLR